MFSRMDLIAVACAMAVLMPDTASAQTSEPLECQAITQRVNGYGARDNQLIRELVRTVSSARAARAAGDLHSARRLLQQGRQVSLEYIPLMKAFKADATRARRLGCIDDALHAAVMNSMEPLEQGYRRITAAIINEERALRPNRADC